MRSMAMLLLLISSSSLPTPTVKTAYLNPTRLEILRTVEMGGYRRVMYADATHAVTPDLSNLGQFFG